MANTSDKRMKGLWWMEQGCGYFNGNEFWWTQRVGNERGRLYVIYHDGDGAVELD